VKEESTRLCVRQMGEERKKSERESQVERKDQFTRMTE